MESCPINWEALDALLADFVKSENLVDSPVVSPYPSLPSSPSSASSSLSSYQSRLLIRHIRRSLEAGNVDCAIDSLRVHAPSLLEDRRILFRLQKQRFIELLRRGTAEDRDCAINCLRRALAPCALDAYPEAYEEFKHVLLAFIYHKDDQTSPVANEWSERRRFDVGGLMSSVLRAHFQAYDPVFAMILRYLISIHKGYCLHQGIVSPISNLTERLLLEERDPAATPQENLLESPPLEEVDIQALAHAVELTRQGAVDSLRFAKGNLFQAFQNELCRMRLDVTMLDELVREYCVYRGIVDSDHVPTTGLDHCSSSNCSVEVNFRTSSQSDSGSSISDAHFEGSHITSAERNRHIDIEVRYPCDLTDTREDCSTSRTNELENSRYMQRNRNHEIGERSRRKRWRSRIDNMGVLFDGSNKQETNILIAGTLMSQEKQCSDKKSSEKIYDMASKYDVMLGIKELAGRGMAAEVVDRINAIDANFFVQNPVILFQLKQIEFLKLVSSGDHSGALKLACTYLGPLAATDQSLLMPLKETLLALIKPNEDSVGNWLPFHTLATSLQVAIGRRLGIDEPQLMKIMRATLHTHNEWFKIQMCKDRFEGLLRIDSLKEINSAFLSDPFCKARGDIAIHGSSLVSVLSSSGVADDGSSPNQPPCRDAICDENAVLKVMEFLALPRADAIHLLAQYNGNPEAVIQQLFA